MKRLKNASKINTVGHIACQKCPQVVCYFIVYVKMVEGCYNSNNNSQNEYLQDAQGEKPSGRDHVTKNRSTLLTDPSMEPIVDITSKEANTNHGQYSCRSCENVFTSTAEWNLHQMHYVLHQKCSHTDKMPADTLATAVSPTVGYKENIPDNFSETDHLRLLTKIDGPPANGKLTQTLEDECSSVISVSQNPFLMLKQIRLKYFSQLNAEEKIKLSLLEEVMSSTQSGDNNGTCLFVCCFSIVLFHRRFIIIVVCD